MFHRCGCESRSCMLSTTLGRVFHVSAEKPERRTRAGNKATNIDNQMVNIRVSRTNRGFGSRRVSMILPWQSIMFRTAPIQHIPLLPKAEQGLHRGYGGARHGTFSCWMAGCTLIMRYCIGFLMSRREPSKNKQSGRIASRTYQSELSPRV